MKFRLFKKTLLKKTVDYLEGLDKDDEKIEIMVRKAADAISHTTEIDQALLKHGMVVGEKINTEGLSKQALSELGDVDDLIDKRDQLKKRANEILEEAEKILNLQQERVSAATRELKDINYRQ